jgi:hypothetical protein
MRRGVISRGSSHAQVTALAEQQSAALVQLQRRQEAQAATQAAALATAQITGVRAEYPERALTD